jgi:hypothetical protein
MESAGFSIAEWAGPMSAIALQQVRTFCLATGLALIVGSSAFAAQQNIGATETAKNQVSRELAGTAGALNSGDPVFRNEVVKTGQESTAKLVFLDSTNLAVGPTSRVVLDRFVYEGGDSTQTVAVKLTKGLFRFTTGSLDKNSYSVTTPEAAIGVRGTVLDISVASLKTKVTLREGRAIVCPVDKGAAFEQLARDCSHEKGRQCHCTGLDQPGETVEITRTASGGTRQTLTSSAVNFEPFCAGGLCDATDYATLTNGNTDLASSIDGPGGGGASLCGR